MILKLKTLLLTSTSTGSVWAALVGSADDSSGGLFITGGYVISAFNTTGRVWIKILKRMVRVWKQRMSNWLISWLTVCLLRLMRTRLRFPKMTLMRRLLISIDRSFEHGMPSLS